MVDAAAAAIRRQAIVLDGSRGIGPILDLIGDHFTASLGDQFVGV